MLTGSFFLSNNYHTFKNNKMKNTIHIITGLLCSLSWLAAIYSLFLVTPAETSILIFALINACIYSFIFLVTAPKQKVN